MAQVQNYSAAQFLETVDRHTGLEFVHFSSPLFSGCKYISKQFRTLARQFDAQLSFSEVAIELQQTDLIRTFEVEQLPTLILLQEGVEVERIESVLPPDELTEFLELCASFYVEEKSEN